MDVPPKWNYLDAGVRKDRVSHERLRLLQAFYTEKFQDKQQVSARKKEIREQLKMHKDDTRGEMMVLLASIARSGHEKMQTLKEVVHAVRAERNPDEMETQVEDDPPSSEHGCGGEENGEEESKTDDEEELPHHGENPFCEEESKQKEGGEEEMKETDPVVHPDLSEEESGKENEEESGNKNDEDEGDDYVGDEKTRKDKEGGAMKETGSL
eukprot:s1401_g14.t1